MIRSLALLFLLANPLLALECSNDQFEDIPFSICSANVVKDDLRIFFRNDKNDIFGRFQTLDVYLQGQGLTLDFAMNGGMFRPDLTPVGLYIEDGKLLRKAVSRAGPGNFGMLPNGVFCISKNSVKVLETSDYLQDSPSCHFATQSGPMLVIDGKLHPKFLENSSSRFIRNGVGTSQEGQWAHFVITNRPIIFHKFARLFKDHLGLNSALYLDGNVSQMYAPPLNRGGHGRSLGPIIGAVSPAAD